MAASAVYRRPRRAAGVLLMVAAAGLLSARLLPARAETSTYVGGVASVIACKGPGQLNDAVPVDTPGVGVGGGCFNVPPGATTVAVRATDDVTGAPAIEVYGHYADQTNTAHTLFCDGSGSWAVPQGVSVVFVTDVDPVTSGCANAPVPVKGTITATFS